MKKLFVIGLDCAAPELVFQRWADRLPNLSSLVRRGLWGELQSCTPAITVPAWACMLSGRDPGELGIYGFRNRADHTYENMFIATSATIRHRRIWDYLTESGKRSIVIGVPPTYPVRPLNGLLISDFLTPGVDSAFAHPASLKDQVLKIAPDYDFDVRQFRTDDKDWLLRQIWEMTEKRFKVVDHLLRNESWDFFMLMEIGVDRMHHGFWSYHDPKHRRYQAGNPYETAIRDYYVFIDRKIGEWLNVIGKDTAVLVVSDHGAKRMDGGICLNEWLWREGYLAFKEDPSPGKVVPFGEMQVDWPRTTAWGDGGYYGRVFLNVEGREPEGTVPQDRHEAMLEELAAKLEGIPGPTGQAIGTRVFQPREIYRSVTGAAPDLMVYFGDLLWRSVGSVGHGSIHTFENDTGPDDCNHAENGLFILTQADSTLGQAEITGAQLMDVTSTILDLFGLAIPPDLQGVSLLSRPPRQVS